MKVMCGALLVVHGLIHLMGFVKAFGVAEIPRLTWPISRPRGVLWLLAAAVWLAAATGLFTWPRGWWALGACAIVVSQAAIATSWRDAKNK